MRRPAVIALWVSEALLAITLAALAAFSGSACVREFVEYANAPQADELRTAATCGDTGGIRAILESRPRLVNSRDAFGWTPLHEAARIGSVGAVKLLLAHGADIRARNDDGQTPLDVARRSREPEAAAVLLRAESARRAGERRLSSRDTEGFPQSDGN